MICFIFLLTRIGQKHAYLSSGSKNCIKDVIHLWVVLGKYISSQLNSLSYQCFTHSFLTMVSHSMGNFMTKNNCETRFVLCNWKKTGIYHHFSPRHTPCIHFFTVHQVEFPLISI